VNQFTPYGSLQYNQTGTYNWTDPYTGTNLAIPQFTATQSLTPQGQAIVGQQMGAQFNMAGTANEASKNLAGQMANPINLSQIPAQGQTQPLTQAPMAQTSIDTSQLPGIQTSYGDPSQFAGQANQLQQSIMQRLQPQINQQQEQLRQQLADQGIQYGSQAYNNAFTNFNNQLSNLQLGAVSAADTEQQNLQQMAAAQGAFANQAQAQGFSQAATQGQFTNAAQAQNYAQLQANFAAQNQANTQALQNAYALRDQPINEISALMSGSQISQPNFVNTQQAQIPTTDVAGLINQNFNQQFQNYQQQSQNWNSLMGGLMGMAGGMMKMSDIRAKEDLVPMGSVWATKPKDDDSEELPIYSYAYQGDPSHARHVGPMAQDVEKIDPQAVKQRRGIKYVDQDRLGSIIGVSHG
jgi:hypothetical protein